MIKFITNWMPNNKLITALGVLLLFEVIFLFFLGHRIIEAMYREESLPLLNNMLKGRAEQSLDFYIRRLDLYFISFNFTFASLILFFSLCWRLFSDSTPVFYLVNKDFLQFKESISNNKRIIVLSLILSLTFYSLYVSLGLGLSPFNGNFFGADQNEWLSLEWYKYYKGSYPTRLLFLEFFGFLRLFSPPIPMINIAVFLNAFFGALCISSSFLLFWVMTRRLFSTIGLTLLFGLSMNQLFFSALPESRSLQALSIIPTYFLLIICLQTRRIYFGYWILAGLFSFGVLITNFGATFLCFSIVVFSLESKKRIRTILEYGGTIVSLGFFLNILQKEFLKGQYFFVPNTITTELNYVKITLLNDPLLVLKEIMSNFLLVNFISPSPFVNHNTDRLGSVNLSFFERGFSYNTLGWIALIVWIILFFWGFYSNVVCQQKFSKIFLIAIGLAIFSNVALHSFFGVNEMFIYTTNFSLPVLLLTVNKSLSKTRFWKLSLVLLILLMGINNLNIMREVILALKT